MGIFRLVCVLIIKYFSFYFIFKLSIYKFFFLVGWDIRRYLNIKVIMEIGGIKKNFWKFLGKDKRKIE